MRDTTAFSGLGSYQPSTYELSGVGDPMQIDGARLTANIFPVLGVSPLIGRGFTQREDDSHAPVTVLSYQIWQSRFHGERNILGQKILLDRKPYEVIGVMPRDFEFPLVPGRLNRSELWIPMSLTPDELQGQGGWSFYLVGRLKPGVTLPRRNRMQPERHGRSCATFPRRSPGVTFIRWFNHSTRPLWRRLGRWSAPSFSP